MPNYKVKCLNSITGKLVYNETLPSNIDINDGDVKTNTLLLKAEMKDFLQAHVYCSDLKKITPDRYDTIIVHKL